MSRPGPALVLMVLLGPAALLADVARADAAQADPEEARAYFTDTVLINQHGEELKLYSDLLRDHTVVINVIFTDCQGVCPVTMGNLVKIQNWLGSRLGDDTLLLSLTVDRETDTPERLARYARDFSARDGWHFLTGTPENLDFVLRRLGLWVENKEGHSSIFLVGNVPTGLWKKAHGMASADKLIRIVDSVLRDRLKTEVEVPLPGHG